MLLTVRKLAYENISIYRSIESLINLISVMNHSNFVSYLLSSTSNSFIGAAAGCELFRSETLMASSSSFTNPKTRRM